MSDFIDIPSFLTDGSFNTKGGITPLACTWCQSFCEVYNECCGYEDCMAPSESGCTSGCENICQSSCEKNCQSTCEKNCQSTCESICQTGQNPAINAVLSFSNITTNSVVATVTGLDSSVPYYLQLSWFVDNVFNGNTTTTGSSSSKTITGLSSGTQYTIRVEIYNGETQAFLDYLQKNVTTLSLPKLPSPTLDTTKTIKTGNSISITINSVSGATTYYARINGGNQQSSSSRTFTFTGLNPNTQYFIEIKCGGSGYEDSNWAGYYATTLSVVLWEWINPKTSGTEFNITRAEWIAFQNKINEVRVAKGLSVYSFTTSSTYIGKDKPFYAWIWLQAAEAISDLGTGVASDCLNVKSQKVSMGNDSIIYPWYFDNLKTALNNAISS